MDDFLTRRQQREQATGIQTAVSAAHPEAIDRLHRLIDNCGAAGVSDMHVHPDKPVRLLDRDHLILDNGPYGIYSAEDIAVWLHAATAGATGPLEAQGHVSVAMATERYRVRGTFRKSLVGTTVTFRLIPTVIPDADTIGVPRAIQDLVHRDSGLVIFYGPTGSGKTTAIATLVKMINLQYDKHIYMVEDPTEFVHEEIGASSIVQRQIGIHAADYPTAIEDALRSKPNVIMIGELRNPAEAKAALHAATTGHLVFTTAHAGSISEALDSFIGQFPADEQPQIRTRLSQSLLAIMVQKLVPATDGTLTAAREVLINNMNFAELIREEKSQMIRGQLAGDEHSFTLEHSLLSLVKDEKITPATALAAAKSPADLLTELRRAGLHRDLTVAA